MVYHTDLLIRPRPFEAISQNLRKIAAGRPNTRPPPAGIAPIRHDCPRISAAIGGHFRGRDSTSGGNNDPKTNNQPNNRTQPPQATPPAQTSEHTNLSYLYGSIGIQAVAAAARYSDVRKKPGHASGAATHRPALRGVRGLAARQRSDPAGLTSTAAGNRGRDRLRGRVLSSSHSAAAVGCRPFFLAGSPRSGQE